jgi:hypothetical protein
MFFGGLFFGLGLVLPQFWPVVALVLIVVFVYAAVGCQLMAGAFAYLHDSYSIPQANFDSLFASMVSSFQLLNGESWNVIMFGEPSGDVAVNDLTV